MIRKLNEKRKLSNWSHKAEFTALNVCPRKSQHKKRGFGFVRGAIGVAVGLDAEMLASGLGANKIVLTCTKCGYQWKPGKK